jgi:hypothetical protein
MKGKWFLLLFPLLGFFSCAGEPEPVEPEEPVLVEEFYQEPVVVEVPKEEENFDPATITEEVFADTLGEVQRFIEDLNGLISGKNFNSWLAYLGDTYRQMINSPEYLQRISEMPTLKKQGIVLKSAEDYFSQVVVPSRANARVDDIEFVSQNRVKAFTLDRNGTRLRLYDLEKGQENWKIIN